MAYRVGIIGAGRVAQEHARAILSIGGEVAAVCDLDPARAQEFADAHYAPGPDRHSSPPITTDSIDALLAMDDVRGVIVAVPNAMHSDVATASLRARKDVLLEKPMAMSVAECDAIIAERDRAGAMLQMGFVCRYAPRSEAVRKLIASSALGTIYHAKATMIRTRGIPGLGRWFTTKAQSGGGVLIDIGVHLIDLVMHLTGRSHAERVSGICESRFGSPIERYAYEEMWAGPPDPAGTFDVEDSACGLIRFPEGLSLELNVAWAANIPAGLYRDGILLLGDRGGCFFDLWSDQFIITRENGRRVIDESIEHDNTEAWNRAWDGQHEAFRRTVLERCRPEASGEAGRNVQAIVEAMYESSRSGREVAVS